MSTKTYPKAEGALQAQRARALDRVRRLAPALTSKRLVVLASAAATLIVAWRVFRVLSYAVTVSRSNHDEDHFVWEGWSLNRGLLPYRDFTDFKPPLVFVTNAIALRLFGLAGMHYRFFFMGFAGIGILALAAVLLRRKANPGLVLALTFVICALWTDSGYHDSSLDDAESIGMMYYFVGLASLLWPAPAPRWTMAAAGALLSCAVLSKEPFALTVVPTWLAGMALVYSEMGRRHVRRYVVWTLAGVAGVLGTVLGFFVLTGTLGDYVHQLRQYLPFSAKICVVYGVWKPVSFLHDWSVRIDKITANLVNVHRLGVAAPLLLAPLIFARGKQHLVTLACALAVAGGLYAITLGGCFFPHYYLLGMPALFLLMAWGVDRLSAVVARFDLRVRVYVGAVICLVAGIAIWPRYDDERYVYRDPSPPFIGADVLKFVDENSSPSDTIFSTGWQDIYVYANRRNAVRESTFFDAFLMIYPGATDEERVKPIYDELVKSRPKIIYIEPEEAHKRTRTVDALVVPFVRDFGYRQVGDKFYVRPD